MTTLLKGTETSALQLKGISKSTMSMGNFHVIIFRELRLELARMRMRLNGLEKDHVIIKHNVLDKPPKNPNVLSLISKKPSRLNQYRNPYNNVNQNGHHINWFPRARFAAAAGRH